MTDLQEESPRRKRRLRKLSRDEILTASVKLLDEFGPESASMTQVARSLGVTTMALYRYFHDRSDLQKQVIDFALRDLLFDEFQSDWRVGVAKWMREVRKHWIQHPWLVELFKPSTYHVPDTGFAGVDSLVQLLERAGLDPAAVANATLCISRITVGIAHLDLCASSLFGPNLDDLIRGLAPERQEHWHGLLPEFSHRTLDDVFESIIAIMVDSLDHSLDGSGAIPSRFLIGP
jgi:AcrR family transcriptional regulator